MVENLTLGECKIAIYISYSKKRPVLDRS